ncbi:MAG: VIT1/CCC1 transporter family protein [Methermicoccaceae archaeon]
MRRTFPIPRLTGFNIEYGRYVILGSIDGLLAVLGVVIATYTVSTDVTIIVRAGLGGGVALALTNGVGSYLAEGAVEYGKLCALEKPMLRSLKNTRLERRTRRKIRIDSFVHGSSSFVGSLIPLCPFLLHLRGAIYVSVVASIIALAVLGLFSGYISKQGMVLSVVKMVGLGLLIVLALGALGFGH